MRYGLGPFQQEQSYLRDMPGHGYEEKTTESWKIAPQESLSNCPSGRQEHLLRNANAPPAQAQSAISATNGPKLDMPIAGWKS